MAQKAKYQQQAINQYTRGTVQYSHAALAEKDREDNIKSAKAWIKGLLLGAVLMGAVLTSAGCSTKDNGNPIQGLVCGTQNTPSVVCPNAGK